MFQKGVGGRPARRSAETVDITWRAEAAVGQPLSAVGSRGKVWWKVVGGEERRHKRRNADARATVTMSIGMSVRMAMVSASLPGKAPPDLRVRQPRFNARQVCHQRMRRSGKRKPTAQQESNYVMGVGR